MDLVEFMPDDFLTYEDITLGANDNDYDLTAEWISIWAMQRKVSDQTYQLIPFTPVTDRGDYDGETAADPKGWFLKGTTIIFWPTPSETKTVRCWILIPEVATSVSAGPSYIPRLAHKMIVLEAAILIAHMNDREIGSIITLKKIQLDRVKDSLTNRVQQQPQFVKPSVFSNMVGDRRDKAFYDKWSPFDR